MTVVHESASPQFAQRATTYDAHASVQADAARWLSQWLPVEAKGSKCLELGAGTGLFTQYLPHCFGSVISTDISPEMLHICRSRVPNADYRLQDAWEAVSQAEEFEMIVASSLIHWSPDPVAALQHWSQSLSSNGRILLGFFAAPSLPEMEQVIDERGPVEWRCPETWAELIAQTGMSVLRMEAETKRYYFPSAMHFWKTLHGTGATVSRKLKPSAMLKLFHNYEDRFKDDTGVYATWTFCRVEIVGR
ncbi:MAG: class I SAM-dependent methyltransferase [Coraliomargarita sp.]